MMKRAFLSSIALCAALALLVGGADVFAVQKKKNGAAKAEAKTGGSIEVTEIAEGGLRSLREESARSGRVLLINFWATWCTPCREEFPDFIEMREHYPVEKFDLVMVSLDDISEIKTTVPEFLAETKAERLASYLLNTEDVEATINLFDPEWRGELPATFIYDPTGALAYKHRGRIKPLEVRAAIDKALAAETIGQSHN